MKLIQTRSLERQFETYTKEAGLKGSWKGFFNRKKQIKQALAPIDLDLFAGQIVGLIGSNGAGKTTLIKLLTGLIHPSSGEAFVLGHKPHKRDPQFLKKIGVILGQKNQLWWDLTPQDSFELLEKIYDIPTELRKKRTFELAEQLQCHSVLDTQLRRLSLGERMKMEIIGALLHRPQILFLDEPTIGLDLVAQVGIRSFLAEYSKEEKPLIILTSHYMADITHLADRLILLSQGKKVFDDSLSSFMKGVSQKKSLHLSFHTPLDRELKVANHIIKKGVTIATIELDLSELMPAISELTQTSLVQELKIEERDFEDVMREFLQT